MQGGRTVRWKKTIVPVTSAVPRAVGCHETSVNKSELLCPRMAPANGSHTIGLRFRIHLLRNEIRRWRRQRWVLGRSWEQLCLSKTRGSQTFPRKQATVSTFRLELEARIRHLCGMKAPRRWRPDPSGKLRRSIGSKIRRYSFERFVRAPLLTSCRSTNHSRRRTKQPEKCWDLENLRMSGDFFRITTKTPPSKRWKWTQRGSAKGDPKLKKSGRSLTNGSALTLG